MSIAKNRIGYLSTVEASKVVSSENVAIAHDAYTRLLQRIPPDSQALWQEVEELVIKTKGVIVIDDTCAGYLIIVSLLKNSNKDFTRSRTHFQLEGVDEGSLSCKGAMYWRLHPTGSHFLSSNRYTSPLCVKF